MRKVIVFALWCAFAFWCCDAHAQYNPIPNFTGTLAGKAFRDAVNNKLSGGDSNGISPVITSITFSQLPGTVQNGKVFYIQDGAPGTPCTGGGQGAWATGVNNQWNCGPIAGGPGAPTSVTCNHLNTIVGSGTFLAGANNASGSFTTPSSTTDVDNCTINFSVPSANNRVCQFGIRNVDGSASSAGVADTATTTSAKVDFPSAGGTVSGTNKLTIAYECF